MCDPNLCSLLAAYDAADAILDDLGDLHENPALARGTIAANRKSQQAVRHRYPCDGAVRDMHNELDCPVGSLWRIAHALATTPSERTGWAFDPEELVDAADRNSPTGAYL